jgi:quercetin dioxygenase-like cupin family protein
MTWKIALATAAALAVSSCNQNDSTADTSSPAADNQAAAAEEAQADNYNWGAAPPVFPAGAQMAVLHGDPGKSGAFVVRLKFPANYQVAAHYHPTDEHVTIISGGMSLGMGDKLDRAKADALKPGGYVALPAKMSHYVWTDSGVVLQVQAEGPFALTYVNPADDPTRQSQTQ